ncbi:MAG: outer membrane protein assembly factor [Alistipes sp.]|nr:outer membrane protein assembly factor [Alistipes sp.]
MIRSAIISCVALLSVCGRVAAQSDTYAVGNDTIAYRYTPFTVQKQRKGFFRRLSDYIMRPADDVTSSGFSIFGGPSYSSETSLKLGVVALFTYRMRHDDFSSQPSDVSLSASASLTGFYRVAAMGNTFFRGGKHRLIYDAELMSQPTDFWGLGYEAAMHNPKSQYTAKRYGVSMRYRYELLRHTYIGVYADFRHSEAVRLHSEAAGYLGGAHRNFNTAGIGAALSYDSRDYTLNAHRGVYLSIEYIMRPKALSNIAATLRQTIVTVDWYRALWRDCIMAVDLYGEFNSDDTPWLLRAQLGDDSRMRGYYRGRFNGNNMLSAQLELRQRIWNRLGGVVWVGAGNVFSEDDRFAWRKTLPNYGIGLRWEFKRRSNLRVDWGMGRKSNSFVLSINEAF